MRSGVLDIMVWFADHVIVRKILCVHECNGIFSENQIKD